MAFARLDGADHQEGLRHRELAQDRLAVGRQARAWHRRRQVGAVVQHGDVDRLGICGGVKPGLCLCGDSVRNAHQPVGVGGNCRQPAPVYQFGAVGKKLGPQQRQQVMDQKIDFDAARAPLRVQALRGGAGDALGEVVGAVQHVARGDGDNGFFQRAAGARQHPLRIAACMTVFPLAFEVEEHRCDLPARRRLAQQHVQLGAYHALDAGLQVGAHDRRHVHQQLAHGAGRPRRVQRQRQRRVERCCRRAALQRAMPALLQDAAAQLRGRFRPCQPRHAGRDRRAAFVVQLQPCRHGVGQRRRRRAVEIERVLAGDLAEHRQVACNDRDTVLGRFDQRQTEAFAFGRRQQHVRRSVQLLQHFVARPFEPEQLRAGARVLAQLRHRRLDHPALFADDDELDVDVTRP